MAEQQTQQMKPRAGDTLKCQQCGMQLEVTTECKCEQGSPRLECCGKPLTQA